MTEEDFRRLALALEGVEEHAHMGHPDFRVAKKVFATMGYPKEGWAMVSLTAEQQRELVELQQGFAAAAGAWGRKGSTVVELKKARAETVKGALEMAWQGAAKRRRG